MSAKPQFLVTGPMLLSYADVKTVVDKLIAEYKADAADGMTLKDWWQLVTDGITDITAEVSQFVALDPVTRKQLIVEGCELFFQEVLSSVNIPGVPNWIEVQVIDPMIGKAINPLVSALIDSVMNLVQKWQGGSTVTPAPTPAPAPAPEPAPAPAPEPAAPPAAPPAGDAPAMPDGKPAY